MRWILENPAWRRREKQRVVAMFLEQFHAGGDIIAIENEVEEMCYEGKLLEAELGGAVIGYLEAHGMSAEGAPELRDARMSPLRGMAMLVLMAQEGKEVWLEPIYRVINAADNNDGDAAGETQ